MEETSWQIAWQAALTPDLSMVPGADVFCKQMRQLSFTMLEATPGLLFSAADIDETITASLAKKNISTFMRQDEIQQDEMEEGCERQEEPVEEPTAAYPWLEAVSVM